MYIGAFKQGDIITRTEKCEKDGSYMGDRFVFYGYENKVAVVKQDRYGAMTITGEWLDGWDFYPEELMKEAKKES